MSDVNEVQQEVVVAAEQEVQEQARTGLDLQAWRRANMVAHVLPSGLEVTLDLRVSLTSLAIAGNIPAPLLSKLDSLKQSQDEGAGPGVKISEVGEYAEAINRVVIAAVIHPKVVADSTENIDEATTLRVSELPFPDRMDIFNTVNEGAMQFAGFRQ